MNIDGTIIPQGAASRLWDVIVVGAGPAGSYASRELARSGVDVLLLDRKVFPREKICGGCLNRRTLSLLSSAGLGQLPRILGGRPLDRFELHTGAPVATVVLPGGVAVSREALDAALIEAAVDSGAEFLPAARARLGRHRKGCREVDLPELGERLEARLVLAADGLAGSFLSAHREDRPQPVSGSRLGAGVVIRSDQVDGPGFYRKGVIYMALDRSGYVGVVRLEDQRLGIAAALEPAAVRSLGMAGAVADILDRRGLPLPSTPEVNWKGTAGLTRHAPRLALHRVFLIGDAAGYVEPFTGEGISWALETAACVRDLALEAVKEWHPELERRWGRAYRRGVSRRQRWCKAVSWALRRPVVMRSVARAIRRTPRVATPLLAHLNAMALGDEV